MDRGCAFTPCDRPHYAKDLCRTHYEQKRLRGKLQPIKKKLFSSMPEKYEEYVMRGDGCWGWAGTISDNGYALIAKDHKYYRAHRFAWEQANGPIPAGALVDHICHNRECTRPDHLRLATHKQNMENLLVLVIDPQKSSFRVLREQKGVDG